MATIGYGDTVVTSNLSRIVVCLSIFWGGIILSMAFVCLRNILKLKYNEKYAYRKINVARKSVDIIATKYLKHKQKQKKTNIIQDFMSKLENKNHLENSLRSEDNVLYRQSLSVDIKFNKINRIANSIELKLQRILNGK